MNQPKRKAKEAAVDAEQRAALFEFLPEAKLIEWWTFFDSRVRLFAKGFVIPVELPGITVFTRNLSDCDCKVAYRPTKEARSLMARRSSGILGKKVYPKRKGVLCGCYGRLIEGKLFIVPKKGGRKNSWTQNSELS